MKKNNMILITTAVISAITNTTLYSNQRPESITAEEIEIIPYESKKTEKPQTKIPVTVKKQTTKKITNAINRKDLGYKRMFSTHYPDKFTLTVNGTLVERGKSIEISEKKLLIQYEYEWKVPWGKRTGGKQVTFEVPEEKDELEIKFSGWKDPQRIKVPDAKKISEEIGLSK